MQDHTVHWPCERSFDLGSYGTAICEGESRRVLSGQICRTALGYKGMLKCGEAKERETAICHRRYRLLNRITSLEMRVHDDEEGKAKRSVRITSVDIWPN